MLQWVAVGYSALQCLMTKLLIFSTKASCVAVCCSMLQCVAACCGMLQRVAVCCSVLQYVAVCCSALQCGPVFDDKAAYTWVPRPPAPV